MRFAVVLAAVPLTSFIAEDAEQFDPDQVSPGVGGFAVIALLAVALFFLGMDLVRRLRRSRYRAEIQADLAEEVAAMRAAASGSAENGASESEPSEARPTDLPKREEDK